MGIYRLLRLDVQGNVGVKSGSSKACIADQERVQTV
jgi:hypothetical protein